MIALEPNAPPEQRIRFIVEILDGIEPTTAFEAVRLVLQQGRISKTNGIDHHCHLTSFKSGIGVVTFLNRKSERFVVYKQP